MTETTSKSERSELVDTIERYVRFWNPGADDAFTAETLVEDVEYCAPVGVLTGSAALVDFRRQFTDHMGSYEFRRRTALDLHHDRARLSWELVTATGDSFAEGTDVLTVADDGRVRAVTVFLDRPPAGFDAHA